MTVHRSALVASLVALVTGSGICALLEAARGNAIAENSSLSALTFTNYAHLASSRDEPPAINSVPVTSPALPPVTAPPGSDASDCEELPHDQSLRSTLNGKRLALDYDRLQKGVERRLLRQAKVRFLSDGLLLAGLGGTLYMLDSKKHVEWKYTASWILWDFAVVESTGLVYGTAGDNIMFILDSSTGRELYGNGRNGKAAYGQVVPFGKDMCLVTDNFSGYRDALDEWEIGKMDTIMQDGVTAWCGTEALWSLPFPPDAELVVSSDRILAVTRTEKSIYVREIIPPNTDCSQ
jgi:hypothetical protein